MAAPSSRSQRSRQPAGLFRSDSDESIDIAALLFEMDLASAGSGSDAAGAGGEGNAAMALQERTRQIQRLLQAFGADAAAAGLTSDATDLPPPIPSVTTTGVNSSRSSGRQTRSATHTPPPAPGSAGGTPNTRRLELRQARNSPGGHRVSYTIDPDFEMDESESESDDDEATGEGSGKGIAEEEGGVERSVEAGIEESGSETQPDGSGVPAISAATSRRKRTSRAAATPESAADAAARTAEYERAAALRELLRFGSAGGVHGGRMDPDAVTGRSPAVSASRQQIREARLIQRAEEEQQLNRAILMSLQENQTADRRPAGEAAAAGAEGPVSSEPSEEDVAMLVSMGFTKEQSTQALVENRMNVELAANRLLGIDF